MTLTYIIPQRHHGHKLLGILKHELKLSVSMLKKLKNDGLVCLDGHPVYFSYRVSAGSVITCELPNEGRPEYPLEYHPVTVLYEDDYFLALYKPAGILVHPSHSRDGGTLANRAAGYLDSRGQPCSVHVVTRLDRDTTGIVLFAKNSYACAALGQVDMCKVYEGLTYGVPEPKAGLIDLPIARVDPGSMYRMVGSCGQPAQTKYKVVREVDFQEEKLALVEFRLLTGRTHQIRVHCREMGWPLVGDPMYYSSPSKNLSDELGLECQQLSAVSLSFVHPFTDENVKISYDRSLDFSRDIM